MLDGEVDIEFDRLLAIAALAVQEQLPVSPETLLELRQFILDRLKHYLRDQSYETSLINAALDAPLSTLPDLVTRLNALKIFMDDDVASSLVAANKRIGNILRKSGVVGEIVIKEELFTIQEETALFDDIRIISGDLDGLYDARNYAEALALLAGLSTSIESFFENVMVMDDDAEVRNNRLNLLAQLKALFDRVANLALIG